MGVDISPTKVQKAIYIAQQLNINCEFSVMDAENLRFEDNSFDWVLCSETLEHVINIDYAVKEIKRITVNNKAIDANKWYSGKSRNNELVLFVEAMVEQGQTITIHLK